MNDYTLAEVFNIVYSREFAKFDNPPKHHFSRRHRKAMREILYPRSKSFAADNCHIPLKKRVLVVLMLILLSAFGIAAGAAAIRGFARQEYRDHTELFQVNADNCPKTIEDVYYLPVIPKEYELYKQIFDSGWVNLSYIDYSTNKTLLFDQYVKDVFHIGFDNERGNLEEISVNGKYALYYNGGSLGIIIWDNEDYIMQISGDFSEDELIALAGSVEIKKSNSKNWHN